jgi:transcriptional regulator with XRE-family HTH domain
MLGQRLKELRKEKKLSQEGLAKVLQLSRATYAQYEIDRRIPEYGTLEKMADYYGVSIDFLVGRSDERTIEAPVQEEKVDPDKIIAEKLLSYLHQGFTNEEIKKRMDFILDVFTLNDEKSDEWIDFVRDQLIKQKRLTPPRQDVKS